MLALFKWLLGPSKASRPDTVILGNEVYNLADENVFDEYVQRLPGFSQGIPVIRPELLVKKNEDLIKQIILARGLAGSHNKATVDTMVLAPIRHLAQMTHLLPASEAQHFKYPGGLFTFCLEVALTSIRYAERRILTRASPEVRKDNETLWAHAAFLNGLFSEAIAVLSKLSVYAHDGNIEWHPGTDLLYGWLERNRLTRYHIRWVNHGDRSKVHVLAGKAIDSAQADILSKGEWAIFTTLLGAMHDQKDFKNPLAKINDQVRYKIMERDISSRADSYGRPLAGMHLEPWLVDAMRTLLQRKRWQPNEDNGRVWYGLDGLFLVWPLAANDMQYQLREAESPFVPGTDEILAEIMLDAGMVARSHAMNGYLFEIAVPCADSQDKRYLDAIKLTRIEILFSKADATPLALQLVVDLPGSGPRSLPEDETGGPVPEGGQNDVTGEGQVRPPALPDANPVQSPYDEAYGMDYETTTGTYEPDYVELYERPPTGNPGPQRQPVPTAATVSEAPPRLTPAAETANTPIPTPEANDDQALLAALFGKPSTKADPIDPGKKPDRSGQKGRAGLLLARLRQLPEGALEAQPGGVTKVSANALKATKLNLNDCVQTLKSAGLLVLVNGLETGLSDPDRPSSRYFLVKGVLTDDK